MLGQNSQLVQLGVGGLGGGLGIAGYESWIITFVILLVLASLAWWTMRPTRRAKRAQDTAVARGTGPVPPASSAERRHASSEPRRGRS